MLKRKCVSVVMFCFVLLFFFITISYSYPARQSRTPIFEGNLDNMAFTLLECTGYDDVIDTNGPRWWRVSDKIKKKLNRKKYSLISETWSGDLGLLDIYREVFQEPDLAPLSAETGFGPIAKGFKEWSDTPDIGEKTSWVQPGLVMFVKGNTLVRVHLNCSLSNEQRTNYVRKIAKSIVKKL